MVWEFYEASRVAGRVAALPPKPKHVAADVVVLAANVAALAADVAAVPSQGVAPNVPINSTGTTPVIIDIEDSDDDTVNSDSTDSIEEIIIVRAV